jgi:calcineurin-like phosphoesterase family protein
VTIYFTADTHFGSERTLMLSRRPFSSVAEMNIYLLEKWNSVVKPGDTVYHLGDYGHIHDYMTELNGIIHFLPDLDHDYFSIAEAFRAGWNIIKNNHVVIIKGIPFNLIHKPTSGKNGTFYLFGHIHKTQMVKKNGLNVGVDCHNFTPASEDQVIFYYNAITKHYDENVFLKVIPV